MIPPLACNKCLRKKKTLAFRPWIDPAVGHGALLEDSRGGVGGGNRALRRKIIENQNQGSTCTRLIQTGAGYFLVFTPLADPFGPLAPLAPWWAFYFSGTKVSFEIHTFAMVPRWDNNLGGIIKNIIKPRWDN